MQEKLNKLLKVLAITLIVSFLSVYLTSLTGYFEHKEHKKMTLTEDAIKRFEQDIKEGKEIDTKNYLEKEKNYNNKASKLALKLSATIEKSFNKLMKYFFKKLESFINS